MKIIGQCCYPWHLMEASDQLHAPIASPQENIARYPLEGRWGGSQSWSRRGGEEVPSPLLLAMEHLSSIL